MSNKKILKNVYHEVGYHSTISVKVFVAVSPTVSIILTLCPITSDSKMQDSYLKQKKMCQSYSCSVNDSVTKTEDNFHVTIMKGRFVTFYTQFHSETV